LSKTLDELSVVISVYDEATNDEPWKAERRGEEPAIAVL